MDSARLTKALSQDIPNELASDLVDNFLTVRLDAATRTYGRTSPGKFVETVVQILQYRTTGAYDKVPNVEDFLSRRVENLAALDDGLRICVARIARSAYTLRSKRNIAHKGSIDPNTYDLEFLYASARWVVAEILRQTEGITMEEAGALIEAVHVPFSRVVEEIDGHRIVHGKFSTKGEILVLLHSHYPEKLGEEAVVQSLNRRGQKSVRNRLRELYAAKLIHGDKTDGFRLTTPGFNAAQAAITIELEGK